MSQIDAEKRTVAFMINLYCRNKHRSVEASGTLCSECANLLDYAHRRLEHCRHGEVKPSCTRCPIHCYSPRKRAQIRLVMRYAGPRMIWHHPILAIRHLWDFLRSRIG